MKKIFLLLSFPVLVCFSLSSCQKEISYDAATGGGGGGGGGGSTYYIKFKKDGVQKNFTSATMAKITDFTGTGVIGLNLIASENVTSGSLEGINIGINFSNGTQPRTGIFREDDVSLDYVMVGVYNPNSTTIVYGAGIFTPTAKPLVVNILTKTATEMTGTFEGAFYKTDIVAGTITAENVLLTEGEFKLKIQ